MKKLLLSFTAALLIIGGSVACKKTKNCVCTYDGVEISNTGGLTKAQCEALEVSGASCSLK